MTSVLMHELGHNFNLAHSGGLDGGDYSDHTGYVYLSFAAILRPTILDVSCTHGTHSLSFLVQNDGKSIVF